MKMYAMKSTSEDGVWYLVNGWNKHKAFWKDTISDWTLFKRRQDAYVGLTKILKIYDDIDPSFRNHKYELIEVEKNVTKYQCYYNETVYINQVACIGKRVNIPDALFDTEAEAERYCQSHVGLQGDTENEMMYEEIEV